MKIYKKILLLLFTGSLLFLTLTGTLYAQQNNLNAVIQKAQESGINKSALTKLQKRAKAQGISDEQLIDLIEPAIDMASQNLPADFAIEKSLEGLSKNIPVSRIAPVLQRLNNTAAEAVKIIDPWMDKPDVKKMVRNSPAGMSEEKFRNELTKATSKALNQNVDQKTAKDIFAQMGDESVLGKASPPDIIAAVGILPDMPQGVDQSQTGKFIVRALKGGFKANELQNLPSAMNMAQQRSELPAASVIEGVSKQLKGGVPAKQILQNLFNGQVGGGPPGSVPKGLENRSDQGNQGNQGNNGSS